MKWVWRLIKFLTGRMFIVGVLIILQIVFYFAILVYLNIYIRAIQIIFTIFALILDLYIVNKPGSPSTKMPFVFLLTFVPVFGVPFYLFCGNNEVHLRYRKSIKIAIEQTRQLHVQDEKVSEELRKKNLRRYRETEYIYRMTRLPVHRNTSEIYFSCGEELYKELIIKLKEAKHFIFLEFFIIKPGEVWDTILKILKEKAQQGLEVRFMYDDIGSAQYLPYQFSKELNSCGIQCAVFNPFNARVTVDHNYRDHRKICVVDGVVGFTGGINLADEYINTIKRFGYWKDSGVMLEGEAVWNETVIFLENWDFTKKEHSDFSKYTPYSYHTTSFEELHEGYVQPYADDPLDNELVGESVYMNILNNASKYVWFTTPYLIIDNEFSTCLKLAAKRGIDVRIVTPGIPDEKWYAYMTTRSYYKELITAGVKIYEYTPGFIHAKNCLSDDEVMTCGTINLDYRSLYHHFENGVWIYGGKAITDLKKDFKQIIADSKEIDLEWIKNRPFGEKVLKVLLKATSPLL